MRQESSEPQDHPTPPGSEPAPPRVPPIPNYLLDPRPVVILGTLAWTLALLVNMLMFDVNQRTMILCAVGVGVGALGTAVYAMQRRAVLRGSAGAQQGLEFLEESRDEG